MKYFSTPVLRVRVFTVFLTIISLPMGWACAQSNPDYDFNRMLEASAVREDFSAFRAAIDQHHPDLYRYRSKQSLDGLLDSCQASIKGPMNLVEFNNLVRYAVSAIECGHTSAGMTGEMMEQYAVSTPVFPLKLWFAGARAFVLCSKTENAPAGSEILSIDGEPIEQIRQRLMRYLPSDGKIQTKKNATLNNDAFVLLYNFVYGAKASFQVSLIPPGASSREIGLQSTGFKQTLCPAYKTGINGKPLEITYHAGSIALLGIRTFTEPDMPAFLETTFQALAQKDVDHLIIDLRGNGGGQDMYGALLYSYLTTEPFRYFSALTSREKPVMTTSDHAGLEVQQPSKTRFTGKVVILTDGRTFSTAADFCAIARSNGRAVFVGEETGGGYQGNNSGGTLRQTLPHTGLQISVPTIRYTNAVRPGQQTGQGIIPDYPVAASVSDMLEGRDTQLETAIRICND
ncbi:Peptidase family S41 [Dyadobacter soli]|uniref:Peptidase family S41 n=1 Tax=Dyadobacter soli TaxID=659014 RepID=A0A1G7MM50_9BACT|nr:S41 family peptidase [Dyadobacter soli]SDF62209.1 Peptidase family S41 [Dyadobacter soli]